MVNPAANIDERAKDIPERLYFFRMTGRDRGYETGEIRNFLC